MSDIKQIESAEPGGKTQAVKTGDRRSTAACAASGKSKKVTEIREAGCDEVVERGDILGVEA